jgi:hypothetical protein
LSARFFSLDELAEILAQPAGVVAALIGSGELASYRAEDGTPIVERRALAEFIRRHLLHPEPGRRGPLPTVEHYRRLKNIVRAEQR